MSRGVLVTVSVTSSMYSVATIHHDAYMVVNVYYMCMPVSCLDVRITCLVCTCVCAVFVQCSALECGRELVSFGDRRVLFVQGAVLVSVVCCLCRVLYS